MQGPGFRPGKRDHGAAVGRHDGQADRGLHAHSAQRLSAAQEASRVELPPFRIRVHRRSHRAGNAVDADVVLARQVAGSQHRFLTEVTDAYSMAWLELPSVVDCDADTLTPTYGKFVAEPFERGFGVDDRQQPAADPAVEPGRQRGHANQDPRCAARVHHDSGRPGGRDRHRPECQVAGRQELQRLDHA